VQVGRGAELRAQPHQLILAAGEKRVHSIMAGVAAHGFGTDDVRRRIVIRAS
jgi:hypothetical protein